MELCIFRPIHWCVAFQYLAQQNHFYFVSYCHSVDVCKLSTRFSQKHSYKTSTVLIFDSQLIKAAWRTIEIHANILSINTLNLYDIFNSKIIQKAIKNGKTLNTLQQFPRTFDIFFDFLPWHLQLNETLVLEFTCMCLWIWLADQNTYVIDSI